MPIRNLPTHMRPRERAMKEGVSLLDDIELLAIFLRAGTKRKDALAIAKALIENFKSLKNIVAASVVALQNTDGLGPVKALEIACLSELTRRVWSAQPEAHNYRDAAAIARWFIGVISDFSREHFLLAILDEQYRILHKKIFYIGTRDRLVANPAEVIATAIRFNARYVWCCHNHPSNTLDFSNDDQSFNAGLRKMAQPFQITLLGHVVVNDKGDYACLP